MGPFVRDRPWKWAALAVALMMTAGARAERYATSENGAKPLTTASGPASAKPVAAVSKAPEQVVVLQDGGVMRGRVTQKGDRYVLARETGETYIPASKVLFVAASVEEAYQQRRQRLGRPTSDGHLNLAEWCLRQDLLSQAQQELVDARALDPRHDKLELLERRHALACERQKKASTDPRAGTESQPVALPTPPAYTDVGELPPGAVERFTRRVQPVLVNSCTTAGCHELGGNEEFQLDRAMLRGMSNRRTTMNNLNATLVLVDYDQPQLSPLLTVPRQTHGGMKEPVFGPRREAAFRHLQEWVALVTAEVAKPSPAEPPAGSVDIFSALYNESAEAPLSSGVALQTPATASDLTSPAPSLRYGARLEHWQPRDPFDPEIFNRKYAAQESASVNSPSATPVPKPER